jgi:hypothetical protein
VRVRRGGSEDVDPVLALFDGAVRWPVARGRRGQELRRPEAVLGAAR